MRKTFTLLMFWMAGMASAQEALTFDTCLDRAMKSNLMIKNAELAERSALAQHRASFGLALPTLTADGESRSSRGKEIDNDTNLFVREDLIWYEGTMNSYFTIFNGFNTINTIKRTKRELESNRSMVQSIRNDVTIDLAQRFITVLYLQETISAIEDQIKSSAKQLELAELKFEQGAIAEGEVFKIKAQKANEELALITNQNAWNANMVALKQLMNMPLQQEIVLIQPELDLDQNVLGEQDPNTMVDRAVVNHPAYLKSVWDQKVARSELALARAARLPVLTMRLMYRSNYQADNDEIRFEDQIDENTSKQVRFYLTIPIFNRLQTHAEVKAKKYEFKQAEVFRQMEYNRLSQQVVQAIQDAKTALKKNEASAMAFEFSQKSFAADTLKFEMGKINMTEFNTSKILYNTTQAELIRSKYELLFNNALIRFYMGETFHL